MPNIHNFLISILIFFYTEDSGIAFDAGDFLNFDLEMSKPKDEPPAKKKKGESETTVSRRLLRFYDESSYSVTKVFNYISQPILCGHFEFSGKK